MKRISAVHVGLFLILCLLFSSAVAEDRPTTAPPSTEPLTVLADVEGLGHASSRDIFGCSKNRQNRIVENSTYPLDDFGFR